MAAAKPALLINVRVSAPMLGLFNCFCTGLFIAPSNYYVCAHFRKRHRRLLPYAVAPVIKTIISFIFCFPIRNSFRSPQQIYNSIRVVDTSPTVWIWRSRPAQKAKACNLPEMAAETYLTLPSFAIFFAACLEQILFEESYLLFFIIFQVPARIFNQEGEFFRKLTTMTTLINITI